MRPHSSSFLFMLVIVGHWGVPGASLKHAIDGNGAAGRHGALPSKAPTERAPRHDLPDPDPKPDPNANLTLDPGPNPTGGVGAEPRVSRISWGALALEVGKSPTEVTRGRHVPRSLPSAICEFTSSSSPS